MPLRFPLTARGDKTRGSFKSIAAEVAGCSGSGEGGSRGVIGGGRAGLRYLAGQCQTLAPCVGRDHAPNLDLDFATASPSLEKRIPRIVARRRETL